MKKIVFTPAAQRQWMKLPVDVRRRIDPRLTDLASTGHGDVKRLKGRDGARLRIGDWRVIFYQVEGSIVIAAVGHRRDVYD
ncbi:MAG: type II toxin-antitoxin system RelE/ParE family toxin [Tardiphaga sp.]